MFLELQASRILADLLFDTPHIPPLRMLKNIWLTFAKYISYGLNDTSKMDEGSYNLNEVFNDQEKSLSCYAFYCIKLVPPDKCAIRIC